MPMPTLHLRAKPLVSSRQQHACHITHRRSLPQFTDSRLETKTLAGTPQQQQRWLRAALSCQQAASVRRPNRCCRGERPLRLQRPAGPRSRLGRRRSPPTAAAAAAGPGSRRPHPITQHKQHALWNASGRCCPPDCCLAASAASRAARCASVRKPETVAADIAAPQIARDGLRDGRGVGGHRNRTELLAVLILFSCMCFSDECSKPELTPQHVCSLAEQLHPSVCRSAARRRSAASQPSTKRLQVA